LIEEIKKQCIQ